MCSDQAFSLAFVTLFHITAGDPWPEEPALYDQDGTVNWKVGGFHIAYEISVNWVILQARVSLAPQALNTVQLSKKISRFS